jgi:GMP synthase-like glutamine amidotransferase
MSSQRIVLLQHAESSPPGHLTSIFPMDIIRLDKGDPLPQAKNVDLLISVGGEMHVKDTKKYPFLKKEMKLIEEVLKQEKKFLGICLGGELLAHVLGAKVHRGGGHERGWFDIDFGTKSQRMFSNHSDRFELPSGAKRFATSRYCLNHGISYDERAYGLQFHPNSHKETIEKIARQPIRKAYPGMQMTAEVLLGLKDLEAQHQWLKEFCLKLIAEDTAPIRQQRNQS